jgi:hypothetical protein
LDGFFDAPVPESCDHARMRFELNPQKRRVFFGACNGVVKISVTICIWHATAWITSVGEPQQLQPMRSRHVLLAVNTLNPRREAMVNASSRRYVKVAPPTVHAGVGNALREAFAMDGEVRSLKMFEDLLAKLD